MTLTEALAAARERRKSNALATLQRLINRSHDCSIDDGDELIDAMILLGTDDDVIDDGQRQHRQAIADREARQRRRESFAALAGDLNDRQYWKTFADVPNDDLWTAAERLFIRICTDTESPLRNKMQHEQRIAEFLTSLGYNKLAAVGWVTPGGYRLSPERCVEQEFQKSYEPLHEACKAWACVPPRIETPGDPSDDDIAALRSRVDELPPANRAMFPMVATVVGGFLLYVAPITGPIDELQQRVEQEIERIHGELLQRIRSRRGVAVGV